MSFTFIGCVAALIIFELMCSLYLYIFMKKYELVDANWVKVSNCVDNSGKKLCRLEYGYPDSFGKENVSVFYTSLPFFKKENHKVFVKSTDDTKVVPYEHFQFLVVVMAFGLLCLGAIIAVYVVLWGLKTIV